jgi:cohesin complex subunit SCC1
MLTEMDLLAPLPDPAVLLGELDAVSGAQDPTLLDWGTQSLITDSIERVGSGALALEEEPLYLDIEGLDDTLEVGRRERPSEVLDNRPDETSMKLYDDDLPLDLDDTIVPEAPEVPVEEAALDIDMEDAGAPLTEIAEDTAQRQQRERETLSPLSDIRPSVERELEQSFAQDTSVFEPQDETIVEAEQRVKRRRLLQEDKDTEMHSADIRALQADRSKILKPQSFLPRDPVLLALMNMQKNGSFVTDILGNGRAANWAPQLADILSIEVIRRSGELKRKRDSGVADLYSDEEGAQASKQTAQLEFEQHEDDLGAIQPGVDTTLRSEAGIMEELPSDLGVRPPSEPAQGDQGPGDEVMSPPQDFDDTTYPLVHPADSGPISQGTKRAVHLLREHFGEEASDSAEQRQKTSVMFQDLLPEKTTSRKDATKMFFEVLVLATKDAIKVDQGNKELGGPIRLRAKRGLWGAWAEEKAGGEIATQEASAEAAEAS